MSIRKLSLPDLPDVVRIQRECYSQDILESMDSFSAKLTIQGASLYWQRHGFEPVQVDESLQKDLFAYGDDAVYMERIDEGV